MKTRPVGSKTCWITAYDKFIQQCLQNEPELIKVARASNITDTQFVRICHILQLQVHHIKPKAHGGNDEIVNYVAVSETDHMTAHYLYALNDVALNGHITMPHPIHLIKGYDPSKVPELAKLRFIIQFDKTTNQNDFDKAFVSATLKEAIMFFQGKSGWLCSNDEGISRLFNMALYKKKSFNLNIFFDFGKVPQYITDKLNQQKREQLKKVA